MNIFRIAAITNPGRLGKAIASKVQEGDVPTLQCIGPESVNVATKAIALTNNILIQDMRYISAKPEYVDLETEDCEEIQTGIRLQLLVIRVDLGKAENNGNIKTMPNMQEQ